ncbi:response regulator transcription factor [Streptomyces brevispora]|uniref:response regulator transcription factor n=1 Tax=Streptomyces brevispora TaxID=887462 RepID=UPI002E32FCAF|nr:response regulator transcription factor [Streptomyces brevispora]
MSIRIVVAGKYALPVEILARYLDTVPDFSVVGSVKQHDDLLSVVALVEPAVVVVETGTMDDDVLGVLAQLRTAQPQCGVALIENQSSPAFTDQAIRAGVLSVVSLQAELPYLIGAIRGAAVGCLTMDPGLFNFRPASHHCPLSARETDVLRLTASGASLKEIARDLYLAVGTVRNLASTAIRKLQARNRFDAARIATEQRWL